jgi:enoyl-CoA hydratase/carnithine racemase
VPNHFQIEDHDRHYDLRLVSEDGTNRLTRACVLALTNAVLALREIPKPVIVAGNAKFFSAGADLAEIQSLTASSGYEFAKLGQRLLRAIEQFPAPVYAAVQGYCMGGGLDLALACHSRIASPHAVFGHRGAALGLVTGWGGTQRLARLVGKAPALAMFIAAEKLHAQDAFGIGLVDAVVEDPVAEARRGIQNAAPSEDHVRATPSALQP